MIDTFRFLSNDEICQIAHIIEGFDRSTLDFRQFEIRNVSPYDRQTAVSIVNQYQRSYEVFSLANSRGALIIAMPAN